MVLGLFVFGALILGGLFLAPIAKAPSAPIGLPLGVPAQSVRFVSYDLAHQHPANDPVFRDIDKLKSDAVLLQGVDEDDAVQVAELLGLQRSFHPQLYQRSEHLAGRRGTWGNLILSQHDLYGGSPLGGVRGGFGGWAACVIDGKEFFIADLHLAAGDEGMAEWTQFQQIWKSRGSPPLVVAVLLSGDLALASPDFQAARPGKAGPWFFFTRDWRLNGQGQAATAGNGDWPTYVDLSAAHR